MPSTGPPAGRHCGDGVLMYESDFPHPECYYTERGTSQLRLTGLPSVGDS